MSCVARRLLITYAHNGRRVAAPSNERSQKQSACVNDRGDCVRITAVFSIDKREMANNSFVNNVWHYSGLETVSSWLYGHASSASKSAGHACCNSGGVANATDKVKGHCLGAAGHWHRLGGRGGGGPCFVRLAGISGALAVGFGAYGAHVFNKKPVSDELKKVYETGNHYHLIHSLALMAVPLTRRPVVTGSLFLLGMMLFCGSCYFHALTENKEVRAVTPYGGMLLILGWISMVV